MSAKSVQYDRLNYNVQSVAASRTTGCYSHLPASLRFPGRGTRSTVAYIGWQRPNPSRRGEGFVAGPINRHIGPYNFKPWVRVQGAASQSTLADCNRDFLISISITGNYYYIFIKPRSKQGREKKWSNTRRTWVDRICIEPALLDTPASLSTSTSPFVSFRLFTW
jgi:hypothetical protein